MVAEIAEKVSEKIEAVESDFSSDSSMDVSQSDRTLDNENEGLGSYDDVGTESFNETGFSNSMLDQANDSLGESESLDDGEFDVSNEDISESDSLVESDELNSTYKERLDRTPVDGPRGEWTGERGESTFRPKMEYMKEYLNQNFGIDGIEYKNAIPDFSECSESTVEIDNMSEKRYGPGGNFEQCDTKCAEKWNSEAKGGKTDWTPRDVADWREENKYSWHERNDMKTCDLIPTKVNDYFSHLGGVAECKRENNSMGGEFDD